MQCLLLHVAGERAPLCATEQICQPCQSGHDLTVTCIALSLVASFSLLASFKTADLCYCCTLLVHVLRHVRGKHVKQLPGTCMHSHTACTSLHRVRRGNCCIFALHMAYAAGANASVTAITSASAAPIAVVCSASKRLALTAADLGATSAALDPAALSGLWPGPSTGPDAVGANGTGMMANARLAGEAPGAAGAGLPLVGGNRGNATIAALYDASAGNDTVSVFVAEVHVDAGFQVQP